MIKRNMEFELIKALKQNPAVVMAGPRQSGKTTLAKMVTKEFDTDTIYLDLEDTEDKSKLTNPKLFLEQHIDKLVIIDEAQIMPELFSLLRSMIDTNRRAGRFLLLGSASPSLERQANQSLAGRVAYLNLSPFMLSEVGTSKMADLWLRGGFPLSFLSDDEGFSVQWRKNYIRSFLGYDLNIMGYDIRIDPQILRNILELIAHYQGQTLNVHNIANAVNISRPSIVKYINILQETFMLRELRPYSSNLKVQIVKSPKVYIRDSGILHSLLKIHTQDALAAYNSVGISWESFCLEQILTGLDDSCSSYYLRTEKKEEVDLVLQSSIEKPPVLVEFKYSKSPKHEKGFYAIKDMVKPEKSYIVYPGDESYPVADDIEVLSIFEIDKLICLINNE